MRSMSQQNKKGRSGTKVNSTMKKPKKKSIRELKKVLWVKFSKWIRKRDNYTCFTCGKKDEPSKMDAGHYVPRSKGNALYFDERNVNTQCTSCNRFKHGNLAIYALKLEERYEAGIIQELFKKGEEVFRPTHEWYEEKIAYYKETL